MPRPDLSFILNLYLDWFDAGGYNAARVVVQPKMRRTCFPAPEVLDISRVEDAARRFLNETLPPDVPVHFALSIIESLAYTTSRFAVADRANGLLYRAAALRILEAGLPSQAAPQSE